MTLKTNFAAKPTLEGRLVSLRPVETADAAGLLAMDYETERLTGSRRDAGFTLENLKIWYASRADHDDRIDLSIIERATRAWAGEVVLNDLNSPDESCGFRILLQGPRFYGRGLGSEATRLVLEYAFNVVGVHRIELEVYDFNPRARHVYEKIGFTHEGTKRDALLWDGTWVDCHCMALLQPDWQKCPLQARVGESAPSRMRVTLNQSAVARWRQVKEHLAQDKSERGVLASCALVFYLRVHVTISPPKMLSYPVDR